MKQIVYVPLDERPCNYEFPLMMAQTAKEIELIHAPKELLGQKKQPADVNELQHWLENVTIDADALVFSVEMLLYGGLLPSRLHHLNVQEGLDRLSIIEAIKKRNPELKLYGFSLIMRTPKYSSSDEEPDYYEQFGQEIFTKAYLEDKANRTGLNEQEHLKLAELEHAIPQEHLTDYANRRTYNIQMLEQTLKYVAKDLIDVFVIPQDDSAPYGYTALDQMKVQTILRTHNLQFRVLIYPGADEVGATMLGKAYCDQLQIKPKIFPLFPSINSEQIVPLYEDRPLGESMKAHIYAVGGVLVTSILEADIVLAYNTAGEVMLEASQQLEENDITYTTHRHLLTFLEQIQSAVVEGKAIAVADCAYANGGDLAFIQGLDHYGLLDKIVSYKGWNTNCNTLGTTLAAAILALNQRDHVQIQRNIVYHLLDDVMYQAIVRKSITEKVLPQYQNTYFDITNDEEHVMAKIEQDIVRTYKQYITRSLGVSAVKLNSYSPWHRMFEIGFHIDWK